MTINIFVLKGDLNGKIVVVRFFFVRYILNNFERGPFIHESLLVNSNLCKLLTGGRRMDEEGRQTLEDHKSLSYRNGSGKLKQELIKSDLNNG